MQIDSECEPAHAESPTHDKKQKSCEDIDTMDTQVKNFRGKLRQLVEMPPEILFEIFDDLKPLDLLHLARTTKYLRAVLMNRSSTSIWKHARSQLNNLPDCPDDLNEPQYAELIFGTACTFCQQDCSANMVIWTVRVRTCSTCLSEQFYLRRIPVAYPKMLSEYIETMTPSWHDSGGKWIYPRQLYLRLESEYLTLQTGRDVWVAQKVNERKAIHAHAELCEKWEKILIDQRRAIIMERVKTLGWADELERNEYVVKNDPYIKETCQKEITDSVLLHVDAFINTCMGAIKARRLRKERGKIFEERSKILVKRLPILHKTYHTCVSTYPVNSIIPCSADVFLDPFVQDLVENPPPTATLTDKDLVPVETAFPDIVLRWRKKTEEKLSSMFAQACGTQHTSESMLQLATAVFSCKSCSTQPLTYPRVLIHQCATNPSLRDPDFVDENKDLAPLLYNHLNCAYWNLDNLISCDPKTIVSLTEVIKLCGVDPTSFTREDMNQLNPIFQCLSCNDVRKGRCTLSWLGVIPHQKLHPESIKLLDDENATMVRDRMAETSLRNRANTRGFCCIHCKLRGDVVTLAEHVKEDHQTPDPTDKDIVPLLDYTHIQREYRLWPPNPVTDMPNLIPLLSAMKF